jgi:hypothetical protein
MGYANYEANGYERDLDLLTTQISSAFHILLEVVGGGWREKNIRILGMSTLLQLEHH